MRIYGPGAPAAPVGAPKSRRAAASAFSVENENAGPAPAAAAPLRSVAGIDALIALQGIQDPLERRQSAVKRGRVALDALDELKMGLLGGTLSPATLVKLKAAAGILKDGSGDPNLDGVLAEIELRVEVEIAKMSAS